MLRRRSAANTKFGLLRLPDDVLIIILSYLDLRTQLKLKHLHLRFKRLMPHVWRSYNKSALISLIEMQLSDKDLRFFLESTQQTLSTLRFKMNKRSNFELLTSYSFPNLKDFRFSTHSFTLNDADLPKMLKTFPNLTTFSPHGKFTGKTFEEFVFLEHLTVSYCSKLEVTNLIQILKTRNIKSLKLGIFDFNQISNIKLPWEGIRNLEFLQCYREEMLMWFLPKLEHLTHLKKLFLCGHVSYSDLRQMLLSAKKPTIDMIEVNQFTSLNDETRGLNLTVKILKVSNYGMSACAHISINVKELYMRNSVCVYEWEFDALIQNLKTHETLGLSRCTFGFKEFTFDAEKLAENRTTILNIYVDQNRCRPNIVTYSRYISPHDDVPMIWRVQGEHRLFKLHFEHPKITFNSDPISIYFDSSANDLVG
ncbi:uncharacterized protein LOC6546597 isoform X2 [Drosophila erecta]|uniref:F-box domain-containing protein n=1 Tax=Drosophila erecta TaxID=7220 RepID=B3NQA9_DROER|nr:uncharacterized protein LOC6546597 isoform X2 [Drosophila erecta]EDV55885.2 uncharacterized protein Dere_GG20537 [Drosophila erecta]